MPDNIDRMDTFSHLKASVDKQEMLLDRRSTKHVRFTQKDGIYLHRGVSGSNKAQRLAKRAAAGEQIFKAIAFEHSLETAKAVFNQVLGDETARQPVTLEQLNKIDAALKKLQASATKATESGAQLSETLHIQQLTRQAKRAIRDSDKLLYSVVAKEIREAPAQVRAAVVKELKNYERALGLYMRKTMEANLADKGLALVSERDSIVRSRTVNLLKLLDPDFKAAPLSRQADATHDENTTMGAIRNEFNRQNVHGNVPGKAMSQGMAPSSPPEFIGSRAATFKTQSDMLHALSTQRGQPELLVQTFFMPWQDSQGSRISHGGSAAPVTEQNEGLALIGDLSIAAHERAKQGLPPLEVKILINDPKTFADTRSPGKMSLDTLRKELERIDPKGVQVEIWGAEAEQRDSHHKKMTVAIGGKGSDAKDSGVLVQTGNHDSSKRMLDSGVKLTGKDPARQQRKEFYKETVESGKLLATNVKDSPLSKQEKRSKRRMSRRLAKRPPRNDRNAGNTLMTHQPPNRVIKNQFRLSEPYALIKSGIRSAKSKVRIVMPYFQLLDLNDEIKAAMARGVDVDIVLAPDQGSQEMIGQSNRDSANDLADFRQELADFNGEAAVGKLKIGWFQPSRGSEEFNPMLKSYPHQKFVSIDDDVSIIGSFNSDYQSMHSAEQMVMVPSDDKARQFFAYMSSNTISHHLLPHIRPQQLNMAQKMVRSYVGPPSYERLGLNAKRSEQLPINRDKYAQVRFESIDESVVSDASDVPDVPEVSPNLNRLDDDNRVESIDET